MPAARRGAAHRHPLAQLTSLADVYWGLLAIADFTFDPAAAGEGGGVGQPGRPGPRLQRRRPASLPGCRQCGWQWGHAWRRSCAHLEIGVVLSKLAVSARSRYRPSASCCYPGASHALAAGSLVEAAADADGAPAPGGDSLLYTTCALLLLLVSLSCSLLQILTYPKGAAGDSITAAAAAAAANTVVTAADPTASAVTLPATTTTLRILSRSVLLLARPPRLPRLAAPSASAVALASSHGCSL